MSNDLFTYWKSLAGLINSDQPSQPRTTKRVTVHSVTAPANVVRHDVKHVRPDTTPLIEKRGWKRRDNIWTGDFATRYGTWPGRIERRGDIFNVLIKHPPPVVEHSGRIQCFADQGGGWWSIHLHDNPVDGDPNAVVDYVERLLHRSFHNHSRQA